MEAIREAAVAGMFYPAGEQELRRELELLLEINKPNKHYKNVVGIISPHAGYIYSGKSAAYAYNILRRDVNFETVIIISPSHREYFQGISIYNGDAYKTPLGITPINKRLSEQIIKNGNNIFLGVEGHRNEHALEVQLPFLQMIQDEFSIVPIVIGDQSRRFVDDLAYSLSKTMGENTVVVVSSDLSHFHEKYKADQLDSLVINHINNFDYEGLMSDLETHQCEACGGGGIVAFMKGAALQSDSKAEVISHTDSSDVSGDTSSVVGYLSAVVYRD